MGLFKDFVEGVVPIGRARLIRRKWGRTYQAGQFGIEVEYRFASESETDIESESETDIEFDDDSAWAAFHREVDVPEDPDRWEGHHDEPVKPDAEDYEYNEDPLVNYWNLDMDHEPMGKPLPEALVKYSVHQTEKLIVDYPERFRNHLLITVEGTINRLHRLYEGVGDFRYGHNMFASRTDMNEYIHKAEMAMNISPERFESELHLRFGGVGQMSHALFDYLRGLQHSVGEALHNFRDFHLQQAGAITEEAYNEKIKQVWEKDYKAWEEEHDEWEEERDEVQSAWDEWDEGEAFYSWLEDRPSAARSRGFSTNRERFEREIEREPDTSGIDGEIGEVEEWIRENGGGGSGWKVFEDEEGIVEIASPILAAGDLGFVKSLLGMLQASKKFDNKTGLHVHIGMPETTDSFDLLAVAAVIDEKAVLAMAGRSAGTIISGTAKGKDVLFGNLYNMLSDGVVGDQELRGLLDSGLVRYYGVNTIKAFNEHHTVEMRYLSSTILDRKDGISNLFGYINYFLMLPRLAQSRNQIRYLVPGVGTLFLSRRMGGKVEIRKFPVGGKAKPGVPMAGRPVAALRQPEPQELPGDRKARLVQKYGSALKDRQRTKQVSQAMQQHCATCQGHGCPECDHERFG